MEKQSSTLPTFAEIAQARIEEATTRDKTIVMKVAINTARMMVENETKAAPLWAFAEWMRVCAQRDEMEQALRRLVMACEEAHWPVVADHMAPLTSARAILAKIEARELATSQPQAAKLKGES